MVLKGEIPWSPELRVEPKSFKIFFVHTVSISLLSFFFLLPSDASSFYRDNLIIYISLQPNRTYYLEDPEGFALEWCRAIENMRVHYYGLQESTA